MASSMRKGQGSLFFMLSSSLLLPAKVSFPLIYVKGILGRCDLERYAPLAVLQGDT